MSFKLKFLALKSRFVNIIFWSVVSAAFIGPGTVTTATKAGATFGFDLLWTLLFSTFACLLLQEASARITIYSGMNLGQAIAKQFEGRSSRTLILILVIGAIILGSAAYETGNILGSVAGLGFIINIPSQLMVAAIGVFAFAALSMPSLRSIAKFMGMTVMLMGFAFLVTAIYLQPDFGAIFQGITMPSIPDQAGAGLLILGLIGTTVVPYDLFLGSGVADNSSSYNSGATMREKIKEMRFGLSVAIILGGIISMSILVVGTVVEGEFSYTALTEALTSHLGGWAVYIFGFGMFAAGFSSAITAPLASAITAKSLFQNNTDQEKKSKWETQSLYFKLVWGFVLVVGLAFGITDVKPIPAIILAQALNGLILPFISIFIIFVVNDSTLMGKEGINGWGANILMGIVVWVTLILGMTNVIKAIRAAWDIASEKGFFSIEIISIITLIISLWILGRIYIVRTRRSREKKERRQRMAQHTKKEK